MGRGIERIKEANKENNKKMNVMLDSKKARSVLIS